MIDNIAVEAVAREVIQWPASKKWTPNTADAVFRGYFGAPVSIVAEIWNMIEYSLTENEQVKHLLWALVFLKTYSTELVHCGMVGWPDAKTFRKWTWHMLFTTCAMTLHVISSMLTLTLRDGISTVFSSKDNES